jgi:UDP-N-acetylglucosamine acyltransferase
MTQQGSPLIHPTALISSEAELAPDVVVGPYTVIEGPVRLGSGCVIRPHVHLIGPLTMGCGNQVHTGAVIGDRPQHQRFDAAPSGVVLGEHNTVREHVTIHSGTVAGQPTTIGDDNYLMAGSHVAHDCQVANRCIFANGALLGGHCHIEDGVFMSGNCAVHQFTRVGRLALLSGCSIITKDLPCFMMVQGINSVVNLNVVGLRRAGIANESVDALRRVYRTLYHDGLPVPAALEIAENKYGHVEVVAELIRFVRHSHRGIVMKGNRHAA